MVGKAETRKGVDWW